MNHNQFSVHIHIRIWTSTRTINEFKYKMKQKQRKNLHSERERRGGDKGTEMEWLPQSKWPTDHNLWMTNQRMKQYVNQMRRKHVVNKQTQRQHTTIPQTNLNVSDGHICIKNALNARMSANGHRTKQWHEPSITRYHAVCSKLVWIIHSSN